MMKGIQLNLLSVYRQLGQIRLVQHNRLGVAVVLQPHLRVHWRLIGGHGHTELTSNCGVN